METLRIPQAVKRGWIECPVGGCFDWSFPSSRLRRGRVQGGGDLCPTLTSQGMSIYVFEKVEYEEEGDAAQHHA